MRRCPAIASRTRPARRTRSRDTRTSASTSPRSSACTCLEPALDRGRDARRTLRRTALRQRGRGAGVLGVTGSALRMLGVLADAPLNNVILPRKAGIRRKPQGKHGCLCLCADIPALLLSCAFSAASRADSRRIEPRRVCGLSRDPFGWPQVRADAIARRERRAWESTGFAGIARWPDYRSGLQSTWGRLPTYLRPAFARVVDDRYHFGQTRLPARIGLRTRWMTAAAVRASWAHWATGWSARWRPRRIRRRTRPRCTSFCSNSRQRGRRQWRWKCRRTDSSRAV